MAVLKTPKGASAYTYASLTNAPDMSVWDTELSVGRKTLTATKYGSSMKTPEGYVKDEIKKWLKEQGAYFFLPVQMGMGARTLDILCCWKGRFVGIEVKRPGKIATKLQAEIICQIQDAEGIAVCVDSLSGLKEFIREESRDTGLLAYV